jgi:hypothetical protein
MKATKLRITKNTIPKMICCYVGRPGKGKYFGLGLHLYSDKQIEKLYIEAKQTFPQFTELVEEMTQELRDRKLKQLGV